MRTWRYLVDLGSLVLFIGVLVPPLVLLDLLYRAAVHELTEDFWPELAFGLATVWEHAKANAWRRSATWRDWMGLR